MASATSRSAAASLTTVDGDNTLRTDIVQTVKPTKKTCQIGNRFQPDQKTKQQKLTRLADESCQDVRLRCSKCKMAYEDACWTRIQRQNHRAQHTSLVCKACRAQGFHPRNLEAYTCQTCKSNLGTTRFNRVMLKNYKQRPGVRLQCMQCFAHKTKKELRTTEQDTAAPTPTADRCASELAFLSQAERSR